MIETTNLVGIHTTDPQLPGTLYLAPDGNLTKDVEKAERIPDTRLARAIREISPFSNRYFIKTVAAD